MSRCIVVSGPSFPKDSCVWIDRCQRPYVIPPLLPLSPLIVFFMYRMMFQKKGGANSIVEGSEFVLAWVILQGLVLNSDI
jgi:hypothetical protein